MFSINYAEVNALYELVSQILDHRDFYRNLLDSKDLKRIEKVNEAFESFLAAEESWADCAGDESDTNIILGME